MVDKSRASHGLSTDVWHSGWKSPPPSQNTSTVIGNLKWRSISVSFGILSEIPPIGLVGTIQKETQHDPKTPPDRSQKSYRVRTDAKYICPLTPPPSAPIVIHQWKAQEGLHDGQGAQRVGPRGERGELATEAR